MGVLSFFGGMNMEIQVTSTHDRPSLALSLWKYSFPLVFTCRRFASKLARFFFGFSGDSWGFNQHIHGDPNKGSALWWFFTHRWKMTHLKMIIIYSCHLPRANPFEPPASPNICGFKSWNSEVQTSGGQSPKKCPIWVDLKWGTPQVHGLQLKIFSNKITWH